MDPDKVLEAIDMAMLDVSIGVLTRDGRKVVEGAMVMMDRFMDLSAWLHNGGSLPKYWQRDEPTTKNEGEDNATGTQAEPGRPG